MKARENSSPSASSKAGGMWARMASLALPVVVIGGLSGMLGALLIVVLVP